MLNKIGCKMFVNFHDSGHVAASIAVVRSRKHGHKALIVKPTVALHDKLMSTDDEIETIFTIEFLGYVMTERVASATR